MMKIGETIGLLIVNWDYIRSHRAGNHSLTDKDTTKSIAKDRFYAQARFKYAKAHIT